MKRLVTITLILMLAFAVQASAQGFVGLEFGSMLTKGQEPGLAYNVVGTLDIQKITGPLIEGVEISALYSDWGWDKASETYAIRTFMFRAVYYQGFFLAVGGGGWSFINTDGADLTKPGFAMGIGYKKGPLIVRFTADAVQFDGPDRYFVRGGFSITP